MLSVGGGTRLSQISCCRLQSIEFSVSICDLSIDKSQMLTENSIDWSLQHEIWDSLVPPPTDNMLYVVYVEPGVVVQDNAGKDSSKDFYGRSEERRVGK